MANQNVELQSDLEELSDEQLQTVVGGYDYDHNGIVTVDNVGKVELPVVKTNPVVSAPTPWGEATVDDSKDALD